MYSSATIFREYLSSPYRSQMSFQWYLALFARRAESPAAKPMGVK